MNSDYNKSLLENNIVIDVNNLTKIYHLYSNSIDILKEKLNPLKKKYHRDFYALNSVSFQIKKGETVGIIGPNGAGKSTLLKIITGVLNPTFGSVNVQGKVASLLELGAGFNPEMTGYDNIYLNGSIMGFTKAEVDAKIGSILEFADIGEFIYQPVKSYSSGMFARLAFATAINVEPDILIVDEALSVGDIAFQSKCFQKFQQFQKENRTILFVTHSIDLILKHCQVAIVVDNGKIMYHGNTKTATEMFRKMMVTTQVASVKNEQKENKIDSKSQVDKYQLKTQLPINTKANIYGSLEAEIIDFAIVNSEDNISNHLKHNEKYTIIISVKFHKDVIDPIIAYTIKSVDGMELTGTNTLNLDMNFGKVNQGEVITIKFTQNMILNTGSYLLALGCTKIEHNALKVFHRIYDALPIEVVSFTRAVGVAFDLSTLEYSRD